VVPPFHPGPDATPNTNRAQTATPFPSGPCSTSQRELGPSRHSRVENALILGVGTTRTMNEGDTFPLMRVSGLSQASHKATAQDGTVSISWTREKGRFHNDPHNGDENCRGQRIRCNDADQGFAAIARRRGATSSTSEQLCFSSILVINLSSLTQSTRQRSL
jgi:hypothetical protein